MTKSVIGACVLVSFGAFGAFGCAAQRAPAAKSAAPPSVALAQNPWPEAERSQVPERRVGDFYVHVISGTFRKQPALLTERVVAHDGDAYVIEYRLEDNDGARTIRAWLDVNGEVARVSLLLDGVEKPGTLADYEALMASASLAPDENAGFTASSRGTCTVGPTELDCETKNYRVFLGAQEANLGITGSRAVPGLDLSGEITSADGTVIYRSTLVEHGNEANTKDADSFALADPSMP